MRTLRACFVAAVATLMGSCDSGTEPGRAIDHLEIQLKPARSSYPVPDTVRAGVVAFSREGTEVPVGTPHWRSLHPTLASVDASGLIHTLSPGAATIEVEVDGVTAQLRLSIRGILHATYTIDPSGTWRVADTSHVVQHYLRVGGIYGGTDTTVLTIEPGAAIRFRPGAGLYVGDIDPGALVIPAGGAPVVMEGDSAARGSWVGISFEGRGRSELRNLTIRHCGATTPSGATVACLEASAAELLIDGVTVTEAHDGVNIGHGVTFAVGSRDLSIENTTGHMATISPRVAGTFPRGGRFTDNVENEIRITNGLVERSATWADVGAPWRLVGEVTFSGSARPRLTLPAGLVIRSDPGGAISAARLVAGAAGGPPVVLESTGKGWGGIGLGNGSALRNVVLRDCGSTTEACVRVADTGFVVEDVTIRGAHSVGMFFDIGAKFSPASRNLTIAESGDVPIYLEARAVPSIPPGVYRFNATDAIRIHGAQISWHATWRNAGVPYLLADGLGIGSGLSPDSASLTLEPGVVVQMGAGTQVGVGNGALRALGTLTEPVLFTSATPGVAGSWVGLVLGGETKAQLEYVEIQDAGAGPNGYAGAVRMSADPGGVLRNSIIRRSASCGIALFDLFGNPRWTDNYTDPALGNAFIDVAGPLVCPSFSGTT